LATKIRLKRIGRRNRPFYRMVVMDSRSRRDGAAIEELGWYNPIDINRSYSLKDDRILHWLKDGAQVTNAALKLMRRSGIAHEWHLIKQGLESSQIKIEMEKWKLNRDETLKKRSEKKEQKSKEVNSKKAEPNKIDENKKTDSDSSGDEEE